MPRLNRTLIDKLETPATGRLVVMDDEQPNFGVRISSTGVRVFIVRARVGKGRKATIRTVTLGRHPTLTPEKARAAARDILANGRLGTDPNTKSDNRTVADAFDIWVEGPGKRTRKGRLKSDHSFATDRGRMQNHVIPLLGKTVLRTLTRGDVERMRDAVIAGKTATEPVKTKKRGVRHVRGGSRVATNVMIVFSSFLSWCVQENYLDRNVALGVHKPEGGHSERFLTLDEARLVIRAMDKIDANPMAIIILKLLLVTGRRYGEIASVKWANLDLVRGILVLQRSKTGPAPTYLSDAAIDLFRQVVAKQSEWVFPATRSGGHYTGTPKVWAKVLKASEIGKARIHDLRHSFASLALEGGASLEQIGELLLHKERRTTMRYAHFVPGATKSVADAVGNSLLYQGQPGSPSGASTDQPATPADHDEDVLLTPASGGTLPPPDREAA